ncbi:MAG: 5'/3'-nucleotidase SurE [Bacteroidales bacterium]|nr:5'/3'-nucleotidase SurE [Bacteroidales bacterium]
MNTPRPLILISNDDGVDAPGIEFLARVASRHGDVVVVAPASAQSGKSSALTVNAPLTLKHLAGYPGCDAKVYSVNGTPVDCVKIALHAVAAHRPALVLSGVNHGSNAAVNNIYSGTMGAAMEGCVVGIPSVGFSILSHSWDVDMKPAEKLIDRVIYYVLTHGLPDGICLNVNFPAAAHINGLKVTRAARGYWSEEYADYTTPSGEPFYWLTGRFINLEPDAPDTDEYWLKRDYGTVVPIRPDQTATDMMSALAPLGE